MHTEKYLKKEEEKEEDIGGGRGERGGGGGSKELEPGSYGNENARLRRKRRN